MFFETSKDGCGEPARYLSASGLLEEALGCHPQSRGAVLK